MMAKARDVAIKRVPRNILDDLANRGNHQSTVLRVGRTLTSMFMIS